jgi:fatty acid desaturase
MKKTFLVFIWVFSLCMAGSEGLYIFNVVGGVLFLITSILIGGMINE